MHRESCDIEEQHWSHDRWRKGDEDAAERLARSIGSSVQRKDKQALQWEAVDQRCRWKDGGEAGLRRILAKGKQEVSVVAHIMMNELRAEFNICLWCVYTGAAPHVYLHPLQDCCTVLP
jgi:hypothetical protein